MSYASRIVFLTTCFISFVTSAQTMKPYFPLSGERLPLAERLEISKALEHKRYDPNQWPEVIFEEKKQSLLPLTSKQTYWQITLPVFNHTTNSMELFSGFKFFPATNYNPKKSRLIVIYPTIEGESAIERNLVRMALAEGHHAVIASMFDFPYQTGEYAIDDIREKTLFGIKAVRTFFDLLDFTYKNSQISKKDPYSVLKNVFPRDILQIGASNGTVPTLMISQIDYRVSHQALIVPIGNVPGVFATTTNEKLSALRKEQMAYHKITDLQEYANLVRSRLQIDPLDVLGLSVEENGPKTLAFTQSVDETVPPNFQKEVVDRIRALSVSLAMDRFGIDIKFMNTLNQAAVKLNAEKGYPPIEIPKIDDEKINELQRKRILEAIQAQQHSDILFHEVGIGHVKKIVAITFLFNKELRAFMNDGFDPKSWGTYFFESRFPILKMARKGSKDVSCKKAISLP